MWGVARMKPTQYLQKNESISYRMPPDRPRVSIIITAWNVAGIIAETLQSVRKAFVDLTTLELEIIVVDDGSKDNTIEVASQLADRVICHSCYMGKGTALYNGWRMASGSYIVFLDAHLGKSAEYVKLLLNPLLRDECDMSIAELPATKNHRSFSIIKGLAVIGIYRLCGYHTKTPLSGQRAIRQEALVRIGGLSRGFGVEVGLTIDVARSGYRIKELLIPFHHPESSDDWHSLVHKCKLLISVGQTLLYKWLHPIVNG
jgi:glycosyltransferase involved in cell wall biosynthesis